MSGAQQSECVVTKYVTAGICHTRCLAEAHSTWRFNLATAVWKGLLRFGLLSIPVKLYRAGQAEKISFRQLHKTTGARVRQQRSPDADHIVAASLVKDTVGNSARGEELNSASIPKLNGRAILDTAPLKSEDLIKGYEFEKGSYVRFSREELARVAPATAKEIELCE